MDFPWIMELKTWLEAVVGQVRVAITLPHIKRQELFGGIQRYAIRHEAARADLFI